MLTFLGSESSDGPKMTTKAGPNWDAGPAIKPPNRPSIYPPLSLVGADFDFWHHCKRVVDCILFWDTALYNAAAPRPMLLMLLFWLKYCGILAFFRTIRLKLFPILWTLAGQEHCAINPSVLLKQENPNFLQFPRQNSSSGQLKTVGRCWPLLATGI